MLSGSASHNNLDNAPTYLSSRSLDKEGSETREYEPRETLKLPLGFQAKTCEKQFNSDTCPAFPRNTHVEFVRLARLSRIGQEGY